jgi:hypothetical protein
MTGSLKRRHNRERVKQLKNPKDARMVYRKIPCIICDSIDTAFCHFPVHRGMGGANAGWKYNEGVPLCKFCHDALDGRAGHAAHVDMHHAVAARAPSFWAAVALWFE